MKFYIIVEGTPMDGFRYVGPFKSHVAAEHYAYMNHRATYWWVAEIAAPVKTTTKEDEHHG